MFPLVNLIALIDVNAGAQITDAKVKENLKGSAAAKQLVNINVLEA
jgi:hypothetical protein